MRGRKKKEKGEERAKKKEENMNFNLSTKCLLNERASLSLSLFHEAK